MYYFYQLGLKIGLDVWAKYSKLFYFGEQTGIDLPNENNGLVPTLDYFNKNLVLMAGQRGIWLIWQLVRENYLQHLCKWRN